MKILKLFLLILIPFQWFSCINDGNFGGNYTDDCNGNNTEVSFEARDFYTNEPLAGIPFKIYSQYVGLSIYGNDMISEISAFKTTQNGSARNLFSHDKGGYYVYYLAVDSTQNNFLTNSYWGIPAGCLTTYNIRLKPIKNLQISLKNSLGHDLKSFNLLVGNVSPYKKINSIFQPETLKKIKHKIWTLNVCPKNQLESVILIKKTEKTSEKIPLSCLLALMKPSL
jgi:hypothetical protein